MIKLGIIAIISLLTSIKCTAQEGWIRELPMRGIPVKMIQTNDGGYALLASTDITTVANYVSLFKYDTDGNYLWDKQYSVGDSTISIIKDFVETSDNGFLISGLTDDPISHLDVPYLIKTNSQGDTIWTNIQQTYSGQVVYLRVLEKSNGELMTLGGDFPAPFLHHIDTMGGLISVDSNYTFLNQNNMHLINEGVDSIVVARRESTYETEFLRFNNAGTESLSRTYNIKVVAMENHLSGDYTCYGAVEFSDEDGILRMNSSFDSIWFKEYSTYEIPGFTTQKAYDVAIAQDGGLALCGTISNFFTTCIYLIRTDINGNPVWTQKYTQAVADQVTNVIEHPDGGFVMFQAGTVDPDLPKMWLVKTDGNGELPAQVNSFYEPSNMDISVFPIPANENINLSFSNWGPFSKIEVSITSLLGQVIYSGSFGTPTLLIPVKDIKNGIYSLRINFVGVQQKCAKQIVINH